MTKQNLIFFLRNSFQKNDGFSHFEQSFGTRWELFSAGQRPMSMFISMWLRQAPAPSIHHHSMWQFQFCSPKIHKNQKMPKKSKSILMFYPPFSPLLANLSSNSSPSRRALQFGSVKSGFGCTDVEKNDDLVSVTTCFKIFEGISMFFDAFTSCWACFELSGGFKHVFLIRNDTTIIQEYVKKVEKRGSESRVFAC